MTNAPRQIGRRGMASGSFHGNSLGAVQDRKTGGFTHQPGSRHKCTWIPGHVVEVCNRCGMTRPRERNPEGIDLVKCPPPRGFVLAGFDDLEQPDTPKPGWLIFWEGKWRRCSGPHMRRDYWTYLRPVNE